MAVRRGRGASGEARRPRRHRAPAGPLPARGVRRRAAARRHRSSARPRARPAGGRRAHRQPRLGERGQACWRCSPSSIASWRSPSCWPRHAHEVAAAAGRVIRMRDGRLADDAAASIRIVFPVPPRLFRQFILRRMAQERARTLTTIVGIALGIAVVIAIQLTNASSVRGFETALDTVAGRTSVEIAGTGRRPRDPDCRARLAPRVRRARAGHRRRDGHRLGRDAGAWPGAAVSDGSPGTTSEAQRGREGARRGHPEGPDACATTPSPSGEATSGEALGATRRLHHTAVPRAADQPAQHRHHGEAGPPARLRARRRDPADGRRPGEHVRHSRAAEGRRPGARDGRELRADGHRGRAAGLRSPGPRGPTGRAADHRGRIRSGLREDRCGARAGQRPAAGWTHGLAAGAARAAGGAHAGGVPPEPDRAVMGGSGRRFVPGLQHRHHLGHRSARGDRRVASAGRDPSAGAAPVPG